MHPLKSVSTFHSYMGNTSAGTNLSKNPFFVPIADGAVNGWQVPFDGSDSGRRDCALAVVAVGLVVVQILWLWTQCEEAGSCVFAASLGRALVQVPGKAGWAYRCRGGQGDSHGGERHTVSTYVSRRSCSIVSQSGGVLDSLEAGRVLECFDQYRGR